MEPNQDQLHRDWMNRNLLNPDQLNIDTPELVAIEMPLAGIGSRFIATLMDWLILLGAFIVLGLMAAVILPALHFLGALSQKWAVGILIVIIFLAIWGYFALFEAFGNGRTPGKRVAKIRVIHQSGRAVSFVEALGRNLVRYVDYLPGFYALGVLVMFLNRRHQRLGDMVAGTLVVRDRELDTPHWGESGSRTFTAPTLAANAPIPPPHLGIVLPATELAKLSSADLEVLESFFARRLDMDLATRAVLAQRIAAALCAKSGLVAPAETSVETFLEAVAHQLREVARMS
jgi:uncharacterized RDD family membrane protein YckC